MGFYSIVLEVVEFNEWKSHSFLKFMFFFLVFEKYYKSIKKKNILASIPCIRISLNILETFSQTLSCVSAKKAQSQ